MFDFVTDNAFNIEITNDYILSIQVSLDGFSFSVYHSAENKILAFQYSPIKISSINLVSRHLQEWINSTEIFQHSFKKVSVVVFNHEFTIIPELLYQNDLKKAIPDYLFEKKDNLEIAENFIEKLNARLTFVLPSGLNQVLLDFFGLYEITHPLKLIINQLPQSYNKHAALLLFYVDNFYAIIYNSDKILLVNNFKMGHANDVVYFIVNALQQLKITPLDTELILAGSNKNTDDFSKALQPYFENVGNLKPAATIINPEIAENSFLRYNSII